MKSYKFILPCFIILMISCKASEELKTKTDIITANVWKYNKVISTSGGIVRRIFERGITPPTINGINDEHNFRLTFFKDGTFTSINNDKVKGTGIWKFINNETQYSVGEKGNEIAFLINKLEKGSFIYIEKYVGEEIRIELIPE